MTKKKDYIPVAHLFEQFLYSRADHSPMLEAFVEQSLRIGWLQSRVGKGEAVDDANGEGGFTTNPNGKAVEAALV